MAENTLNPSILSENNDLVSATSNLSLNQENQISLNDMVSTVPIETGTQQATRESAESLPSNMGESSLEQRWPDLTPLERRQREAEEFLRGRLGDERYDQIQRDLASRSETLQRQTAAGNRNLATLAWDGANEVAAGLVRGGWQAVDESAKLFWDITAWTANTVVGDKVMGQYKSIIKPEQLWEGQYDGPIAQIVQPIAAFGFGWFGVGKFTSASKFSAGIAAFQTETKAAASQISKAYSRANTIQGIGVSTAKGALTDFAVYGGHEERLSNLVQACPYIANPVSAYLAADKDDPEILGRIKAVADGMGFGGMIEGIAIGLRAMRGWKHSKTNEEAIAAIEDSYRQLSEVYPELREIDLQDATTSAKQIHDVNAFNEAESIGRTMTNPDELSNVRQTGTELNEDSLRSVGIDDAEINRVRDDLGGDLDVNISQAGDEININTTSRPGPEDMSGNQAQYQANTKAAQQPENISKGNYWDIYRKSFDHPATSKSIVDAITNAKAVRAAIGDKASLKDELVRVAKQKLDEGQTPISQADYVDFLARRLRHVTTDDDEVIASMVELMTETFKFTRKADGTLSNAELLEQGMEYASRISGEIDPNLAVRARETADIANTLAARLTEFRIREQSLLYRLRDVQHEINTAGASPQKDLIRAKTLSDLNELNKAIADIRTGTARALQSNRIGIGENEFKQAILNPDAALNYIKRKGIRLDDNNKAAQWLLAAAEHPERVKEILRTTKYGTYTDILNEYVVNNLLSSPKTFLVNLTGNLVKTVLMPVEMFLGGAVSGNKAAMSQALSMYTGMAKYFRESLSAMSSAFKAGDNMLDKGGRVYDLYNGHGISYDKMKDTYIGDKVRGGAPYDPAMELNAWEEWTANAASYIGPVVRIPSRFLMATDEFFKQLNYRSNLYGRYITEAKAKFGNDADQIANYVETAMSKVFDNGMATDEIALSYARRSTWTEPLKNGVDDAKFNVAQGIQDLVRSAPILRPIIPFVRTPANLIRDFIAHTPGVANLTKRYQMAIAEGGERAAIAKGQLCTGGIFWGTAITLASTGSITGGMPQDKLTQQAWRDQGIEPYSFKIGNVYISYNRFDPFGMFFGMAADFAEHSHDWNKSVVENVAGGMMISLAGNLASKSYLTGLTNFLSAITEGENTPDAITRFMKTTTASIIPASAGLRFMRQAIDGEMRETRTVMDEIINGLPGVSTPLPPKVSWLTGQAMTRNMFVGINKNDPVINEIMRLEDSLGVGAPSRRIKGVELTAEQYTKYCQTIGTTKLRGRTIYEALNQLINSNEYDIDRNHYPDVVSDYENQRSVMVRGVIDAYRKRAQDLMVQTDTDLQYAIELDIKGRRAAMRGDNATLEQLVNMRREARNR